MIPSKKAKQLKKYFSEVDDILFTENERIKLSKAFIVTLLNEIPMRGDDYELAYDYEWCHYSTYWKEVFNCL